MPCIFAGNYLTVVQCFNKPQGNIVQIADRGSAEIKGSGIQYYFLRMLLYLCGLNDKRVSFGRRTAYIIFGDIFRPIHAWGSRPDYI